MDATLHRIVDAFMDEQPEKIILFGSRAYGTPREDSDYDICIIKNFDMAQYDAVAKRLYKKLRTAAPGVPMDFLLYTPELFAKSIKTEMNVSNEINSKGVVLYERLV